MSMQNGNIPNRGVSAFIAFLFLSQSRCAICVKQTVATNSFFNDPLRLTGMFFITTQIYNIHITVTRYIVGIRL